MNQEHYAFQGSCPEVGLLQIDQKKLDRTIKCHNPGLRRSGSLEIISRARSAIRAKYGGKEAEKQYPAPLNRYLEVTKLMFGDLDQLLILGHCYSLV